MDKLDKFRLLAGSATVDGEVAEAEKELLQIYAGRLKLSSDEASQVLSELRKARTFEVEVPKDPSTRDELFKAMVNIIVADGQVTNAELLFFRKVAERFGVDYDVANQQIRDALHELEN